MLPRVQAISTKLSLDYLAFATIGVQTKSFLPARKQMISRIHQAQGKFYMITLNINYKNLVDLSSSIKMHA